MRCEKDIGYRKSLGLQHRNLLRANEAAGTQAGHVGKAYECTRRLTLTLRPFIVWIVAPNIIPASDSLGLAGS